MPLFKPAGTDPAVHSRAQDQARWLIRTYGDEAEAILAEKLQRRDVSPADRYRYKLTQRALKRLRRIELRGPKPVPGGSAARKPRLSSAGRLLRLLGVRATRRGKNNRS
ncbi:MAG: hypothetical protein JWM75_1894 [Sphingomonas bacterium]|nr:hypothetical protein [Sphingomonas bacterium]